MIGTPNWNSNFLYIVHGLRIKLYSNKLNFKFLNSKDTMLLLQPIERDTCFLSGSSYPTHGDIRFVFLGMQEHLMRYKNEERFFQKAMADAIYKKLEEYWSIMDANSCISAVLNPRTKLSVFLTDIEKNKVKDSINKLAEHYSATSSTSITSSTTGINWQIQGIILENYVTLILILMLIMLLVLIILLVILKKYILHDLEDNVELLLWWKAQTKEYPILSQIAHDFLSIQATSVASEQAFSVVGHTITAERNRLHADTARATLCLKSWISNNIC